MLGELRTEWLYDLRATLDMENIHEVGDSGSGGRTIYPITGGRIEGRHISGDLLPFGADFALWRTDGVGVLDIRALLRTDDGAEIYVSYPGLSHDHSLGPLGELAPGERYFRTTPRFETSAEKYTWLNRIFAVGVGWFEPPNTVAYKVYAVL
jgi:hypothetical protein